MKLRLIVEKDPETGRYSSVFPELPGCASAGDTEEEAIANAKEALELWFEPTDRFLQPLQGCGIGVVLDPRVARCALTLGYFISRFQREERLASANGMASSFEA